MISSIYKFNEIIYVIDFDGKFYIRKYRIKRIEITEFTKYIVDVSGAEVSYVDSNILCSDQELKESGLSIKEHVKSFILANFDRFFCIIDKGSNKQ